MFLDVLTFCNDHNDEPQEEAETGRSNFMLRGLSMLASRQQAAPAARPAPQAHSHNVYREVKGIRQWPNPAQNLLAVFQRRLHPARKKDEEHVARTEDFGSDNASGSPSEATSATAKR